MRPHAEVGVAVASVSSQDTLDAANNDAEHLVVERLRKKVGAPEPSALCGEPKGPSCF